MNHLQTEKSPYLLQHVDNPVAWYPWGEPAFDLARRENRLVFLSVGYSTCHWCHVMAHECFEDDAVAELLNRDYVAIKVDREERPDIDQVYMEVCQRLTGGGGWPLTIFMTPEAQPFYAATYIPKYGRQGRAGMLELLPWITAKWREDPDFLIKAAREIVASMHQGLGSGAGDAVSLTLMDQAEQALKKNYDHRHGGFGQAPKFPRPHDLTFLLHRHAVTGDIQCLAMVEHTLQRMRAGGIYDQVGFGFHRYATDEMWLVPHFEKMLYDQSMLILAYLAAFESTGGDIYARTVHEVISYLLRDLGASDGTFFAAEDADSEGVEGKFYLWSEEEIRSLLGSVAEPFCAAYNINSAGNYRDEATGQKTGLNILHLNPQDGAGFNRVFASEDFTSARQKLLSARSGRSRPHLDDKILVAWNGMAISALAGAGRVLGVQDYVNRAGRAADFILSKMKTQEGRLWRRYCQGEAAIPAFAEDYAFLARGLLDLYAADFALCRLTEALGYAELLHRLFLDPDNGRLYDTACDAEPLLIRPSSGFDGATPSASAAAVEVFSRLALLTGDRQWRTGAERMLAALGNEIARYPAGYTQLLQSASWLLLPTREVVVVGRRGDPATEDMLTIVRGRCAERTVVLFKDLDDAGTLDQLAPFTAQMQLLHGRSAAYVCTNFTCREPLSDADRLGGILTTLPG